jgi:hypothetical protein
MFKRDDLIFDQRTLEGLGNLYNSLVHTPIFTRADDSNGLLGIYGA